MLHIEPSPALEAFCKKWHVQKLCLFGSALREDFDESSDVDLLVDFEPDAPISQWDWGPMLEELQAIFGRRVDLVARAAIKNPLRRRYILANTRTLYAA